MGLETLTILEQRRHFHLILRVKKTDGDRRELGKQHGLLRARSSGLNGRNGSAKVTASLGGKRTSLNRAGVKSFTRHMAGAPLVANDNQRPSHAELEASNRELRASLKRCEDLVADCKDKLVAAHGLTLPEEPVVR